jgi:holo-[acyl-carrier protein] synthase
MIVGLGMDIVDVERMARMLERDGERLAARLLTDGEWSYCSRMKTPAPHVAARVAAKEAAFKALAGSDDAKAIGWREIEVSHDQWQRPHLTLHGRAADRAQLLGVTRVLVTLTHSHITAGAVVILEGDAPSA